MSMDQKKKASPSEADAFIGMDIDVKPPPPPDTRKRRSRQSSAKKKSSASKKNDSGNNDNGASGQQRKRPRPAAAASSARKRPKKPKPPPPPPSALVSLLQKNDVVRSYFVSLQENLDYDVEKWKCEAQRWKRLVMDANGAGGGAGGGAGATTAAAAATTSAAAAEAEGARKKSPSARKRPPRKKKVESDDKINGEATAGKSKRASKSKEPPSPKKSKQKKDDEEKGDEEIPITDEALFGDLSSEEEEEEEDIISNDYDDKSCAQKSFKTLEVEVQQEAENERRSHILEKIREAKKCLDMLGVSLVEVEVNKTVTPNNQVPDGATMIQDGELNATNKDRTAAPKNGTDDTDNLEQFPNKDEASQNTADLSTTVIERILHRQPDEKVAAEMMASFKTLIKCSLYMFDSTANSSNTHHENDGNLSEDGKLDLFQVKAAGGPQRLGNKELMRRCKLRRRYHPFCRDGQLHTPTVYYSNKPHESSQPDGNNAQERASDAGNVFEKASDAQNVEESASNNSIDPGGDMPQHPASVGLQNLMNILTIMDTYCGDDLEDDTWNAIFATKTAPAEHDNLGDKGNEVQDEELAIIQVGFRSRSRLTTRILSSLSIEIMRVWALTDRTTNHYPTSASIHFFPADVLDMDHPDNANIHDKFYGEKSYNRLVNLEERIGHARTASLLFRQRGEVQQAAELVVGYIISCAPSMGGAEDYPKLPPVISMCVLEALLAPEGYIPRNESLKEGDTRPVALQGGWFRECIRQMFGPSTSSKHEGDISLLRAIAYAVDAAASIWKERYFCVDYRVRDISVVELAAYERIRRMDDGAWVTDPSFETIDAQGIAKIGNEILLSSTRMSSNSLDNCDEVAKLDSYAALVASGISCALSLLTLGDIDQIIQLCKKILASPTKSTNCPEGEANHAKQDTDAGSSEDIAHQTLYHLLPICCFAYMTIMARKWDTMKLGNATGGRHTAAAFTVEDQFSPILDSMMQQLKVDDWQKVDVTIQCCVILGDGRRLQRLTDRVVPNLTQLAMQKYNGPRTTSNQFISRAMATLMDAAEIPTARVINLKRRPDRLLDFKSCAMYKEQLIVVSGTAGKLCRKALIAARNHSKSPFITSGNNNNNGNDDGEGDGYTDDYYAFDGQCTREELERQLASRLDGKGTLQDFVKSKWRPSELKAFDRDARDDFELVPTSMTEKACALSHIASWTGVESTLSEIGSGRTEYDHKWYQNKLLRMFKISGFARGPALLHSNENMEPVPVCVILEDDAVLVDRFAERLASLLEELPRDFHMCSLGYSKPKAAPIVEYSAQLGIPSCLWYLTGYVLSLEGARHLIKSLPVTGPVDSWIGLKMCSNWDNRFGDLMGVGNFTKAKAKLPSRKDLAKIMKFRAFAALVPLCAQKVGTSATPSVSRRGGWRDKDTDVTYSG